ncbi:hypothetical protein GCM10007079_40460 [Nocardiopsis terrae]|uniref:Flp pilus assembly protein TadD n=1 Tax=Nocardiopsis terrae TaxID=372655 RepID=A0ABR9HEH5_9ACTN|nr:hypothetical protein [Nocardiopsis terrae]MBE1457433.1 Flp pilus assembly protein TadD [Nocardiopsis terrae]GHC92157.1 hypothetical protein GCM10007079_40460 [Nocardiopsis terrae]
MPAPRTDGSDFVDYYALLDTAPDADTATIRDRLDALILEWQQFTGSNKKNLRRRAEDMLELAARAEKTLLDPRRRAAYDTTHAQQAKESTTGTPGGERSGERGGANPGRESLDRAKDAFFGGDHKAARFFANRAVEQDPDLGEAWFILFAACLSLGDLDGAEIAGTTAVRLGPANPLWSSHVGGFLVEALGETERGFALLENAVRHDTTPEAGCHLARHQRSRGLQEKALQTMRDLRKRFPEDTDVKEELALTLLGSAEDVPRIRAGEMYIITDESEIELMEGLIQEAKKLGPQNKEVRRALNNTVSHLDKSKETVFTFRLFANEGASTLIWWSAPIGLLLGVILLANGLPVGLLPFFVGLAAVTVIPAQCRPPRWELNARTKDEKYSELRAAEDLRSRL